MDSSSPAMAKAFKIKNCKRRGMEKARRTRNEGGLPVSALVGDSGARAAAGYSRVLSPTSRPKGLPQSTIHPAWKPRAQVTNTAGPRPHARAARDANPWGPSAGSNCVRSGKLRALGAEGREAAARGPAEFPCLSTSAGRLLPAPPAPARVRSGRHKRKRKANFGWRFGGDPRTAAGRTREPSPAVEK